MTFGSLTFLNPLLLAGLASLPLLWWLLRAVPPAPKTVAFPATELLRDLDDTERTASRTPWWLTLLRLLAAAAVIFALANPVLRPVTSGLSGQGPLILVMDTGWGAGPRWDKMTTSALNLLDEARSTSRAVVLVESANPPAATLSFGAVAAARERLASLVPRPYPPDRMALIEPLRSLLGTQAERVDALEIVWISDGLDYGEASGFGAALADLGGNSGPVVVGQRQPADTIGLVLTQAPAPDEPLSAAGNGQETGAQLAVKVLSPGAGRQSGVLTAYDAQGRALTKAQFDIAGGENSTIAVLGLPLELANQVSRIAVDGQRSAGGVALLDEDNRKRRVALLSSEGQGRDEPLLGSLFFARRALTPYVAITAPRVAELAGAIERVASDQMTTILLADVGTLPGVAMEQLAGWVSDGGVLIRFAGPRMEKARDDLLPAPLRFGGRRLGGALSWEEPRPLAEFEQDGLFAGMPLPTDVRVSRQVLADPAQLRSDTLIWARLDDGTPLVTARRLGRGWLVLFHVTANADWSNLPLSGTFVAMLRRLVALAGSNVADAAAEIDSARRAEEALGASAGAALQQASGTGGDTLAPRLVLDGFGVLGAAPVTAKPIARTNARNAELPDPSRSHPPGYYGPANSQVALNLLDDDDTLAAAASLPASGRALPFLDGTQVELKPWLLLACLALLTLDIAAMIYLQGWRTGSTARRTASALLVAVGAGGALWVVQATAVPGAALAQQAMQIPIQTAAQTVAQTMAQNSAQSPSGRAAATAAAPKLKANASADDEVGRLALRAEAALRTRFAYIITGNADVDERSRAGLSGLARALNNRTAVEPGEPFGVRLLRHDLTFFPILYWPVLNEAETLSDAERAEIDAYMNNGGMVIFDTRDAGQTFSPDAAWNGAGARALQRLLSGLNVPRLAPVGAGHVMTKSFYLLERFPGRWDASPLWVEAPDRGTAAAERARQSDGVSALIVTANDFASAWASDANGRPLYPVVPGGALQREMALRTGVNIVMYALTGNYKADQVHVPALLERLGQ